MVVAPVPTFRLERALLREGFTRVAGIDEVGRGSLAGPIVAAAVVLPVPARGSLHLLRGLRDSKLLSRRGREDLFPRILSVAWGVGVGWASHHVIDRDGIGAANRAAMLRAVRHLGDLPDVLLLDAVTIPDCPLPQQAVIRADSLSYSVAAASVVAKVIRDRWMERWHERYPEYGFDAHKGYSTARHRAALRAAGPCPLHRLSFTLVRSWPE